MTDTSKTAWREVIDAIAVKPYARDLFGVVLDDVSPGSVTLRIDHRPDMGHMPGWFQGAVTSAIGEFAASWSIMTLVPPGCSTQTIQQSIHFVDRAKGERLIAIGRTISSGRTFSVGAADIYVEDGGERTLCAALTLTNRHVPAHR